MLALDAPRVTPGSQPETLSFQKPGDSNGANGESVFVSQRRAYSKITTTNPLRKLKPDGLVRAWDNFRSGYLRDYALLVEAVAQWDDVLMSVIPKREAAVKRLKWQVLVNEDVPDDQKDEADAHREALFNFYNSLTCTHAMDADLSGGFSTFVELAMKCVGNFWAPFEILWQPTPAGLTARFNYVPLQFFEKRTGKLRFLQSDFLLNGDELVPNGWVIFSGPGLLVPSSVCYLIKDLCRQSWLIYCQNQGMPGIHGTTKASFGSEQWLKMVTMLETVLSGGVILTGEDDKVTKLDISASGTLPFPELIREQNERMSTLWRGGSKSTISTGGPDQTGVTLQADEEIKLAADDGQRISSTLNSVIDKIVIEWTFGDGVKPLAYVKIAPPPTIDVERDLKVFDWFAAKNIPLGKQQVREHFSVAEPQEDDELIEVQTPPQLGFDKEGNPLPPQPRQGATGEPMEEDEATEDEVQAELDAAAKEAGNERQAKLPEILRRLNTPRNAKALNALLRKGAIK